MEHAINLVLPHAIGPVFLLKRSLWKELVAELLATLPNEGVGYLAGPEGGAPTHYLPLENELASPTRFRSSAASAFRAHKQMRALDIEMLAVVHSHPMSDSLPSVTDLRENPFGTTIPWLIVSLQSAPTGRLWQLGETATELNWKLV